MTKSTIAAIGGIIIVASIGFIMRNIKSSDEDIEHLKAINKKYNKMVDDAYNELRKSGFKDEMLYKKLYAAYKEWHEAKHDEPYYYQSYEDWRYKFDNP